MFTSQEIDANHPFVTEILESMELAKSFDRLAEMFEDFAADSRLESSIKYFKVKADAARWDASKARDRADWWMNQA